ncbi:glycosyltransferase family 2 protein [Patescibacteria group bacterium]|nr:glycosyltransferase family 2 protein [Candidatus Falkowbacteria bacterium]MBU3905815.1 glycosyltransferase family 2 protein [Patescibacteria group bacterium]MBU4015390.1 glycosyltransferase family 2 protein [Patescibacteria group bacterium]MBU4026010.1 glycosyltransferase family 2 protein [Patescibacteria group bacterium]MBU4072912.1 glycosyltransferase family 2 protein [Patescibacteria group bacterium]
MDLSIIIVSWNVQEKLKENLKAIYQTSPQPSPSQGEGAISFEIFVVDNNSADNTAEMVKNEFPRVKLIVNKENLGFAKANNQAIKKAQGGFILLLNPDMRVFPDTFANMIKWMRKNKQAAVAGCRLVNPAPFSQKRFDNNFEDKTKHKKLAKRCGVDKKGNTINHVRRFPTVWDQLAIVLKLPHVFPNILNKYLRTDFDYNKAAKVDSIRGGFFMFRTSPPAPLLGKESGAMKKILLDERYFLWFEEVDFCKQIQKTGGEVWYTPSAKCVDYVGQSFSQVNTIQKQKYFRDSMLKYFKKWHPSWQYRVLKMAWVVGIFMTFIGEKINFKSKAKT